MKSSYVIIVMLAIACYRAYHLFYPNETCENDPSITLDISAWLLLVDGNGESSGGGSGGGDDNNNNNKNTLLGTPPFSWNACQVFSQEFHEARTKFRKLSRQVGAKMASIPVVMDDGSDDSPLTIDIAILEGDLPGVLVHSSATHGVEGYAGSAIQLALLTLIRDSAAAAAATESPAAQLLPPSTQRPTIVLIHAINPSGMKNYRRFNENNVDLNRNGISNFEAFLKTRDPHVAGYDDFRDLAAPARKPTAWWDGTVGFWCNAIPALLTHGYIALKRVLVAGQYHHPQGIFYGGNKQETSIEKLIAFVTEEDRQILAPIGKKEPVVWIDVHTGLGPFGMDTVITEKPIPLQEMDKRFPTAYHRLTPESKDLGAMDGYELVKGPLTSLIYEISQNTTLTLTQEFGTLPGVLVARAFILENMMYHFGDDEGKRTLGRSWLQAAFYPQSTRWRASIVKRGVSLALQSMEYISTVATRDNQNHVSSEEAKTAASAEEEES